MSDSGRHDLIGILSDSHGNVDATRRAVSALIERGASTLIHLGDFESPAVLDELVGCNAHVVFGNCDYDTQALAHHAACMDIEVHHPGGLLEVGGRSVAFTHGHLTTLMDQAISSGADYLLHGHSHEVRDERVGTTRIINPGALFRAPRYTVALLQPSENEVSWIEIPKSEPRVGRTTNEQTGQM